MAESANGKEGTERTGLEGTGLPLQGSSHGNLRSAGSDQQLRQLLDSLKSSKSPVSTNAPLHSRPNHRMMSKKKITDEPNGL
jgi:thioredoxin 1